MVAGARCRLPVPGRRVTHPVVMSAYLMVSCQAQKREGTAPPEEKPESHVEPPVFSKHKWWDFEKGWKSTLNNLRLIIQPYVFFNLINPWLLVFELSSLKFGFMKLLEIMNQFSGYVPVNSG